MKIFAVAFVAFLVPAFGQNSDCDTAKKCQAAIDANPRSSLAHYRMGEILFRMENPSECNNKHLQPCSYYQSAANEFRKAIVGDSDPKWTEVWSHINLGKIFDLVSQRERAVNEYTQAQRTKDYTRGAQDEVRRYLASPFTLPSN